MKFFKITLVTVVFLSFNLNSEDITTIKLHSSPDSDNNILFNETNENINGKNNEKEEANSEEIIIEEENSEEIIIEEANSEEIIIEEANSEEIIIEEENNQVSNNEDNEVIISMPGDWEYSTKDDLDFLFKNINVSSSKVLNTYFVDSLIEFSKSPQLYSQAEFDNLRIKTLIKMNKTQEALRVLSNITTYENYNNYYDSIKLDYYLSSNELTEACNFKNSLQDFNEDKNNNILKLSIFCSFLENKSEEADLLNSLLIDTKDKDEYFQNIYYNLKNNINEPIDINEGFFDESSFSLYSAMIRIGGLPFTENFLEFDSTNLTLPIILSSATDISLRLKSAHKAYELGLFNAESLSALYQSVDFSSNELSNWKETLNKYALKPEIGMALLFQNVRVQLLPITKFESLKEFWNYAILNNFEKLAYSVSKNLIDFTEPSIELSDYSILLARAHIFNKNFKQAEKWILFVENYVSQSTELDQSELDNVKFLFQLKKSEDNNTFMKSLEENLIIKINGNGSLENYNETLKTVFSVILNEQGTKNIFKNEKKIIDERMMSSSYIINSINNSSENQKKGELILTALVSLNGQVWNDVHPLHIKILLESLKKAKLDNLFKDLIIEILEQSKVI